MRPWLPTKQALTLITVPIFDSKACIMRSLIAFLIILLAGLQYKIWLGDSSVWQHHKLQKEVVQQQQSNAHFLKKNQDLAADLYELKSNEQALEEQARYELGMVRDNEVYYQFNDES